MSAAPSVSLSAGPAAQTHRPPETPAALADETLARVETIFARYIGPMARVLVKREARSADSIETLCRGLAGHIDKPAHRRRFLADLGF